MSVVDSENKSLQEYLDRLTLRPTVIKWKLVRCAKEESWCGDWIKNKAPHFLILLCHESEIFYKPKGRGNKKVKAVRYTDKYRLWCCGTDDLDMAKRGMPYQEANDLFELITTDGISRKELESLGLIFE